MPSLSIGNLVLSIGIGFDAQLKAADNLFFAAAVDINDPTRPMFGGACGNTSGDAAPLYTAAPDGGFMSVNNGIDGDPVTIKQISTVDGPRYQITDGQGKELMMEDASAPSGHPTYQATPRYVVKSDGVLYDVLVHSAASGSGDWQVGDSTLPFGGTGLAASPSAITLSHYSRPFGPIAFKAKEGATLARAQDELSRISSSVQLLVRLLESIQDESKGFTTIIK